LYGEGRWAVIDQDLLALYAETQELYLRFKQDIDDHGTLVQGRTLQERVKNPSLVGLSNARADLIRLSKSIPLVHPDPDVSGAALDSWLKEICASE
jgi:phage terminase small subunit